LFKKSFEIGVVVMNKKGFFVVLLVLAVVILLPYATALADVLVEPDDSFYRKNSNRMRVVNRSFYANGESGYITLVREPNSSREVLSLENGKHIYIMFSYDDNGTVWGVAEINISETETRRYVTGWVQMSQLHPVYNSGMFYNENRDNFIDRQFNLSMIDPDGEVLLWTWPGSGKTNGTLNIDNFSREIDEEAGNTMYIDKDGREWGYITYFYGYRDVWICLTDPSNPDIPAFNKAPEPNLYPAPNPDSTPTTNSSSLILAATLVSLVVTLSLVLIFLFWNKKKQ